MIVSYTKKKKKLTKAGNLMPKELLVAYKKTKNFTKNSTSKKSHNSFKNEFRVISLVCTYSPLYSKHIF